MGENSAVHLPNHSNKWHWGMSLALYSKPYRETNGVQINTSQGEMINSYKYHEEMTDVQRQEIARNFANQVFKLLSSELKKDYPDPRRRPPFDVALGLPENRNTGRSLPRDICKLLALEYPWIKDGFNGVIKTRQGIVMKGIPAHERPSKVAGLYGLDKKSMPEPKFGFLIIDDVFETGSTVGGLCDTLQNEFPTIPRFVVALTHLHATERMAK